MTPGEHVWELKKWIKENITDKSRRDKALIVLELLDDILLEEDFTEALLESLRSEK